MEGRRPRSIVPHLAKTLVPYHRSEQRSVYLLRYALDVSGRPVFILDAQIRPLRYVRSDTSKAYHNNRTYHLALEKNTYGLIPNMYA